MHILGRCTCLGHYTQRRHRWRLLEQAERNLVYCLDCRRQWRSRARYTSHLPPHKPRRRGGMTDSDIMARITNGSLWVDTRRAIVYSNGRQLAVDDREHPGGPHRGTYRFVKICGGGKQKRIALHRLVWMAAHGRTVPDGFDIDHVHNQFDDTIDNLRLLDSAINRGSRQQPQQKDSW